MRPPDHVLLKGPLPCVYAWVRNGVYLYVGSTLRGLSARLQSHHAVKMITGDQLFVWETTEAEINALEQEMITELKPVLNRHKGPSARRPKSQSKRLKT